jgi:hypothetical protein
MSQGTSEIQSAGTRQPDRHPVEYDYHFRRDLVEYLREYARQRPEVAALWCFGIGFILGWKLKPW